MLTEIGAEVLDHMWRAGSQPSGNLVMQYNGNGVRDMGGWSTILDMHTLPKSGVIVQTDGGAGRLPSVAVSSKDAAR